MQSHRILTPEECEKIIAHLEECIAMFERKQGLLNSAELRAKSLLAVMRNEIYRHAKSGTVVPFE